MGANHFPRMLKHALFAPIASIKIKLEYANQSHPLAFHIMRIQVTAQVAIMDIYYYKQFVLWVKHK